jgi:hypothetical protein
MVVHLLNQWWSRSARRKFYVIWKKQYAVYLKFLGVLVSFLLSWLLSFTLYSKPAKGMYFPVVVTVEGDVPGTILAPTLEELKEKPVVVKQSKPESSKCRQSDGTYKPVVCSCVCQVKEWLGITDSIGSAKNWRPNSDTPVVGGVVIQSGGKDGHVSWILKVEPTRVYVREANHKPCQISERWIDLSSSNIIGFWKNN